jgi:hypothetical protein
VSNNSKFTKLKQNKIMSKKLFFNVILTLLFSIVSTYGQNCNDGFKTFTNGGWGTQCNGGNPGCYRDANFAAAFPNGLTIGCGSNTLTLTSSAAVQAFLPSGTSARALDAGNMVDPGSSYRNVLAGQLVAVTLAAGFDAYDPNFSTNTNSFSDLIIANGTFSGMTINQFLNVANQVIGGCSTEYSFSDINATATAINENYDNGTVNNGYLICNPFRLYAITVDSNVNCYGYLNGQVSVTVTGGLAPYVYTLNNGQTSGSSNSTSYTFTGLGAGSYTVSVTDANGITATGNNTFTVVQPTQIVVSTSATDVNCFGGSDGSASIANISGGVPSYTILWSNGDTTNSLFGLSAGTYQGVVTDSLGCTMPYSVVVGQPTLLTSSTSVTNVSCYGGSNGSATVTPQGGTAPYTILWDNGSTAFTRTGLSANVAYTAVVTDAHGCQTNVATSVTQPMALAISIAKTNVTCYGGYGSATATVTGGTAPYSYSWNTNPVQTTQTADLKVGTWTVSITDANGCTASANVTLVLLSCEGFTTVTQGGYGAKCAGNNWGCYLVNNFASKFPTGLTIGSGSRFIKLTSAAAVQAFLPSGTTPRALNAGTLTNPTTKTYSNVLAGQTVALTLSLKFDTNPSFSPSSTSLGSLVVSTGTFAGKTVNELLSIANTILGGGSSPYTATQINDAIDAVNRNYDNGTVNLGYLACPCTTSGGSKMAYANSNNTLETSAVLYPNPVNERSYFDFTINYDSNVKVELYNMNGQLVGTIYTNEAKADNNYSVTIEGATLSSGMYLLKLSTDREVINKTLVVSSK